MSTTSSNTATSVNACLRILKRCSIKDSEQTVKDLSELLTPDDNAITELERENPYATLSLKQQMDPNDSFKRSYIQCEYNRVGDSFRSPWTNTLDPPFVKSSSAEDDHDAIHGSSESLRNLEIQYNEVFASYRDAYFGKEAVSSVYLWDNTHTAHTINTLSSQGFSACFVIQKWVEAEDKTIIGLWNSLHVLNISEISGGFATYQMKTTVFLSLQDSSVLNHKTEPLYSVPQTKKNSESVIGPNNNTGMDAALTRQVERTSKVHDGNHLVNIGKMIEDTENDIRSSMDAIYIPKTKEIVEALHSTSDETSPKSATHRERKQQVSMELNEEMLARILKKSLTSPL